MLDQDQNLDTVLRRFKPIDELPQEFVTQLLQYSEVITEDRGKLLFRRGKRAEFLYYLLQGTVELIDASFSAELVSAGTERARLTLTDTVPTRVSAVAKSKVRLLKVDADFLDLVLACSQAPADEQQQPNTSVNPAQSKSEMGVEVLHHDWMSGLLSSPLLKRIPSANIQALIARFERVAAPAGSVIIQEGSSGDFFYIIDSGKVQIRSLTGGTDIGLGPAQYFGEEALVAESPRNATVTAVTDCVLMRLGKDDFTNLLHKPAQQYISADTLSNPEGLFTVLDVRTPMEYRLQRSSGSINLPLSRLRAQLPQLNRSVRYVLAAEAGRRAQLAAYLLAQEGFETYLLGAESTPPAAA